MTLNFIDVGNGQPIVLLHGMASSLHYWDNVVTELSKTNRVIAVDLLGFGLSPQSSHGYTTDDHATAINETLNSLNIQQPVKLFGHSMGALIALRYAVLFPNRVSELLLASMPLYTSAEQAKQDITKSKRRYKYAYYGLSSRVLCTFWCKWLRPISKRLAPLYLGRLPRRVAADSVLHTWQSYSQSLHEVIEKQNAQHDLKQIKVTTNLVYGDKESQIILQNIRSQANLPGNVKIKFYKGTHHLPLENQVEFINLIR